MLPRYRKWLPQDGTVFSQIFVEGHDSRKCQMQRRRIEVKPWCLDLKLLQRLLQARVQAEMLHKEAWLELLLLLLRRGRVKLVILVSSNEFCHSLKHGSC